MQGSTDLMEAKEGSDITGLVPLDDVATVPTERLEEELVSWAGDIAAAEGRWLVWLGEYDTRNACTVWGVRSAAEWLNWKCGLSMHAAREKVRVARALRELPRLRRELCAGRLSYSKARALTRLATPSDEAEWLQVAGACTASQLERIVADQRRVDDHDPGDAFARRSVSRRGLGGGLGRLQIDLPEDQLEIVWQRLEAEVDAIVADATHGSEARAAEVVVDRGGRAAVRADALVALAVDGPTELHPDTDRDCRVGHLHLTAEITELELAEAAESGRVDIAPRLNDKGIAGPVGERWMCDIDTSVVVATPDGTALGETDKRRTPTRAQRRRLEHRAGHRCEAPGCEASHRLQAHHVVHWARGGPTGSRTWCWCARSTTTSCTRAGG